MENIKSKKINAINKKFFLIFLLGLASCSNPEEEAKRRGFESVAQMEEFSKRGYEDFESYKKIKAFTPESFYLKCKDETVSVYDSLCRGKKVSWIGVVEDIGSDGVEVGLLSADGSALPNPFDIDSKSLASVIRETDIGKIIEFDGVVADQNIVKPDIDPVIHVSIESEDDKNKRIIIQEREEKRKEEEQKKADISELNAHLEDSAWLDSKYGIKAASWCKSKADEYLRSIAKYSFKWDETGWLEQEFDSHLIKVKAPGVVTYLSDKAFLQNGFGAYKRISLECDFDVQNEKVIGYRVSE